MIFNKITYLITVLCTLIIIIIIKVKKKLHRLLLSLLGRKLHFGFRITKILILWPVFFHLIADMLDNRYDN